MINYFGSIRGSPNGIIDKPTNDTIGSQCSGTIGSLASGTIGLPMVPLVEP